MKIYKDDPWQGWKKYVDGNSFTFEIYEGVLIPKTVEELRDLLNFLIANGYGNIEISTDFDGDKYPVGRISYEEWEYKDHPYLVIG